MIISHCSFDLHFSNNQQSWASLHVLLAICVSSSENSAHFLFGWFFCCYRVVQAVCLFWKLNACQSTLRTVSARLQAPFCPVCGLRCWASVVDLRSRLSVFAFISIALRDGLRRRWSSVCQRSFASVLC